MVAVADGGLLRVKDAARRLSVSAYTVRRWAREGRLPVVRLGPSRVAPMRFRSEAIETFLGTHKQPITITKKPKTPVTKKPKTPVTRRRSAA